MHFTPCEYHFEALADEGTLKPLLGAATVAAQLGRETALAQQGSGSHLVALGRTELTPA